MVVADAVVTVVETVGVTATAAARVVAEVTKIVACSKNPDSIALICTAVSVFQVVEMAAEIATETATETIPKTERFLNVALETVLVMMLEMVAEKFVMAENTAQCFPANGAKIVMQHLVATKVEGVSFTVKLL